MSSIKEFQRKIASLQNSRKITGSMKMISSVKLKKADRLNNASAAFRKAAQDTLLPVMRSIGSPDMTFVDGYKTVRSVRILLITGDRGLCGRFNTNAINCMLKKYDGEMRNAKTVTISVMGLRGVAYAKRHSIPYRFYEGVVTNPDWEKTVKVADDLFAEFNDGSVHETWLVYSKRMSSISEEPVVERLLPFDLGDIDMESPDGAYIVEGDRARLFNDTALMMVRVRIYEAVIESVMAEHAARMSAMDSANTNCERLITKYTQLRNRARQAVITTELNEIVTGKEALES